MSDFLQRLIDRGMGKAHFAEPLQRSPFAGGEAAGDFTLQTDEQPHAPERTGLYAVPSPGTDTQSTTGSLDPAPTEPAQATETTATTPASAATTIARKAIPSASPAPSDAPNHSAVPTSSGESTPAPESGMDSVAPVTTNATRGPAPEANTYASSPIHERTFETRSEPPSRDPLDTTPVSSIPPDLSSPPDANRTSVFTEPFSISVEPSTPTHDRTPPTPDSPPMAQADVEHVDSNAPRQSNADTTPASLIDDLAARPDARGSVASLFDETNPDQDTPEQFNRRDAQPFPAAENRASSSTSSSAPSSMSSFPSSRSSSAGSPQPGRATPPARTRPGTLDDPERARPLDASGAEARTRTGDDTISHPVRQTYVPSRGHQARVNQGPDSAPPAPPEITINIGRIEVRAPASDEVPNTSGPPRRPPVLSLSDYMRLRQEGRL